MSDHECTRCGLKVDRASPRLRELFSMKATGAPYARCKACRNLEKREREQAQRAADPEGFDAKRREQYREAYYRRRESPRWKEQTRAAKRAAYQRKKAQQPDDPVERVIELSGLPYAYRIPYTDEFYLATDRKGAAQVWRCRGAKGLYPVSITRREGKRAKVTLINHTGKVNMTLARICTLCFIGEPTDNRTFARVYPDDVYTPENVEWTLPGVTIRGAPPKTTHRMGKQWRRYPADAVERLAVLLQQADEVLRHITDLADARDAAREDGADRVVRFQATVQIMARYFQAAAGKRQGVK